MKATIDRRGKQTYAQWLVSSKRRKLDRIMIIQQIRMAATVAALLVYLAIAH